MNLVLLQDSDAWSAEGMVTLTDHRADHIVRQLKAAIGDVVRVGVLGGQVGEGRVEAIDHSHVTLSVQLQADPPPRHRFDIVLALPRPKMLRRILRTVAEFGVENLHLIHSARVEKSYWQSPLLSPAKVKEALMAGMERSSDTILPRVHLHHRFRPFVEDQLVECCAGRPCWLADRGAPLALAAQSPGPAVVMIGPEGGFVPFEIALAQSVLAQRVHVGVRTLSVDTALTTVLAQGLPLTTACDEMGQTFGLSWSPTR
ncbi:MAG: 16S rRNA (uracil(1498)-N(3))-methyltransferase [Synechococcus sp.]